MPLMQHLWNKLCYHRVLEISVCEKVPEKIKGRERKTWFQPVVLASNMWSALPWGLWESRAFWCAVCPGTDCPHHNSQEAKKDIKSTQWIFSYGLLDRVQLTFILASSEHFQEKGISNHFNVWRGPFKDSKRPPATMGQVDHFCWLEWGSRLSHRPLLMPLWLGRVGMSHYGCSSVTGWWQ